MDIFNIVLLQPMLNILVAFYQLLLMIHLPYALGFSIILLTVVIRLAMYPFMHISMKQQKKMQELAPHMAKIKEKHKNDMKMQQVAQMELYKEHGVNPASGCLIAIVQIPFFIALYNVLLKTVHLKSPDQINNQLYYAGLKLTHLWDMTFFGLPLGQTPQQLFSKVGVAILLVSVITGGLQLIQSKMMMAKAASPLEKKIIDKDAKEDFATSLQKQMMFMMPLMIGFFAFSLPFGLSLYWNTLTIFGIIQQYIVGGWGGLTDWTKYLKRNG
jgi:YidC/Oxa1 family membrane protein insertase